jgi:hypothetical protein
MERLAPLLQQGFEAEKAGMPVTSPVGLSNNPATETIHVKIAG